MTKRKCIECGITISGQKLKYCSNACKQRHHYHRVKQQTNTYHSQTIRALKRKIKLIELLGGGCETCGYDKNLAAMHFHHLDSYQKSFKLDMRSLSNRRWESILQEAKKCILLCANCHLETHNPELTPSNVEKIVASASQRKR